MSDFAAVKPWLQMYEANHWCHARGACLRPYKDFCKRQTESGAEGSAKPEGCWQYTVSASMKKGVLHVELMNRLVQRSSDAAGRSRKHVWWLAWPPGWTCRSRHCAAGRSRKQSSEPVAGMRSIGVEFVLEIHLPITMLVPDGRDTSRQVPLSMRVWYSSAMTARQLGLASALW